MGVNNRRNAKKDTASQRKAKAITHDGDARRKHDGLLHDRGRSIGQAREEEKQLEQLIEGDTG